ncbi:MAG: NADP-dependent oxidoreductase [Deltaproteobacteria bacterium]|nr:NADP-dependent oxidoreductase [Deltaproteobacteria bacterium]
MSQNRQILLARRPQGAVGPDDFQRATAAIPEPGEGELLVRTLMVSIDPTIRGWIDRDTYLPAVPVGDVVRSVGLGVVTASRSAAYSVGDHVIGLLGWQEHAILSDKDRPTPVPGWMDPADALSVFGVTGMTAYFGLTDVGQAKAGETVVVSAAAGATGSIVGQLAKVRGCRVVGIAGSDAKCAWLTGELGFDAAIQYKREDVGARLRETCPDGVHIYFDNVGGPILNAVLGRLAMRGRVVLCGAISQYDDLSSTYGPPNYVNLIARRGRMEGFLIMDYASRFMEGAMELGRLLAEGKLKHRTTVVEGLDEAPATLRRLFTGDHEGKLLVRVAAG